jgi:hypothetical protein
VGATEGRDSAPASLGEPPPAAGLSQAAPGADGSQGTDESGAALFPELVWTHYQWERRLHGKDGEDVALEHAYRDKLSQFQHKEGRLEQVYWSTRRASAVAMTVKPRKPAALDRLGLRERDDVVRLHRVSDWVTRDAPRVADLLHECDLLAMRVSEILRGATEQIALRWILGIEMHLLGFFERESSPDKASEAELVRAERRNLAECEAYYHRAASKTGRIVYTSGMLIGLCLVAVIGAVVGLLLSVGGIGDVQLRLILISYGGGALGALVSTLSRMSKAEHGRFDLDFELGRPLLRRVGVFRPFLGAALGVATFFLLSSGLLDIHPAPDEKPYYYGFAAFLAGFSERFATVVFGAAERRFAPGNGREKAGAERA